MFRLSLTFVCGLGLGVLIMDTLHRPSKPRAETMLAQAPRSNLSEPVLRADATVQHCTTTLKCGPVKRYYVGMVRK